MASHKLNISLETSTLAALKQRAWELNLPVSRYISQLIDTDSKAARDRLATEGYELLSSDSRAFADMAFPLASEVWLQDGR